jgi:hypothetical protein
VGHVDPKVWPERCFNTFLSVSPGIFGYEWNNGVLIGWQKICSLPKLRFRVKNPIKRPLIRAFYQFSVNRSYWVLDYKHYSLSFTFTVVSMGLFLIVLVVV